MDGKDLNATRMFSSNGTVRLLAYISGGTAEIEYIGLANFNAPEDQAQWYITKFTWVTDGSARQIVRIEDSGARQKWSDRENASIMGWRT